MIPYIYLTTKNSSKRLRGSNVLGDGSDGVETRALFLGGDTASHNHTLLEQNGISSRLSCKGKWSCEKDKRFRNQKPIFIEKLIGNSDWRPTPGEFVDWNFLKYTVQEFIYGCVKDGDNPINFCKQGARQGASLSMIIIMVLTRCTGDEAYDYIKGMRDIVETNCKNVCRKFSADRDMWLNWINDEDVVALPCLVWPDEMRAIFEGRLTVELEKRCVKGEQCPHFYGTCCYSKYVLVKTLPAPSQENTALPKRTSSTSPAASPPGKAKKTLPQPKPALQKSTLPPDSVWNKPRQNDNSSQQAPTPRAAAIGEKFDEPGLRPPGCDAMLPPKVANVPLKGVWSDYEGMPQKVLDKGPEKGPTIEAKTAKQKKVVRRICLRQGRGAT